MAALRAELIRRRDTAAAGLAFEFAARLQAELEALDWITAEQKVTQAEPSDFDVHGWAGGVLVRFEVRAGRLSGWTQLAAAVPPPPAVTSPRAPAARSGLAGLRPPDGRTGGRLLEAGPPRPRPAYYRTCSGDSSASIGAAGPSAAAPRLFRVGICTTCLLVEVGNHTLASL